MDKRRIYGLDILRGLSAICIILYHYTVRYNQSVYTLSNYKTNWIFGNFFEWGSMAVLTFFILSGFFSGIYSNKNGMDYIKKRVKRLFPPFVMCCLITSIFMFLFYKSAFVGIKNIILNILFFPLYLGVKPIDGVYWTLLKEVIFYSLVAIMFLFNLEKKQKQNVLIIWIALCIFTYYIKFNNILDSLINIFAMPEYVSMFLIGISLKEIFEKSSNKKDVLILLLSFLELYLWKNIINVIFVVAIIIFIFFSYKYVEKTIPGFGIINYIAKISYPLYLIHQMIGYSIISFLQKIGLKSGIYILIPILVSILLAVIVNYCIENLFIKKIT